MRLDRLVSHFGLATVTALCVFVSINTSLPMPNRAALPFTSAYRVSVHVPPSGTASDIRLPVSPPPPWSNADDAPWDASAQPQSANPKVTRGLDWFVRADLHGHLNEARAQSTAYEWQGDQLLVSVKPVPGQAADAMNVVTSRGARLELQTEQWLRAYVRPRMIRDLAGDPSILLIDVHIPLVPS